jgi:hypothetical protein
MLCLTVHFAEVRRVGDICVDFTKVDLSTCEQKNLLGTPLYRLQYEVKVIFGAREGILKFEAHAQGKVIGNTTINFYSPKVY